MEESFFKFKACVHRYMYNSEARCLRAVNALARLCSAVSPEHLLLAYATSIKISVQARIHSHTAISYLKHFIINAIN